MNTIPIHFDCDTGQDDAIALLCALGSRYLKVKSISVVAGNADVMQCARNTQQILELAGRQDIPVYVGAEAPLQRTLTTLPEVFGVTGMAGGEDLPNPTQALSPIPARQVLTALNSTQTIVATAPLTNLAHALMDEPDLAHRIKKIFLMGGCAYPEPLRGLMGNFPIKGSKELAEYNFAIDPEAAKIVFSAGISEIFMVGLNVTRAVLYNSHIDTRLRSIGTRTASKAADILSAVGPEDIEDYADLHQVPNDPVRAIHDVLAIVCCEDPSIFTFETHPIKIITEAPPAAAGQSLIDKKDFDHPAVHIATDIDQERFLDLLISNISNLI